MDVFPLAVSSRSKIDRCGQWYLRSKNFHWIVDSMRGVTSFLVADTAL
jgi:hypothetical protein